MDTLPKAIYRFNSIYQNTYDIFHRSKTNNTRIYMESQNIQKLQKNPENKEQSWRYKPLRLLTVLQSLSNQNSSVTGTTDTLTNEAV